MKLGISMLIVGLLIAGLGIAAWNYGSGVTWWSALWSGKDLEEAAMLSSIGMGMMVFGGGLSIGGIVRMVVKR